MHIKLLTAATATNGAPTTATQGFPLIGKVSGQAEAYMRSGQVHTIIMSSTAGSATMTVTLKLWAYSGLSTTWVPVGPHATAASRGLLNLGNAIDEIGADLLRHCEMVQGLSAFERVYLEITAIGGTGTAVSAWIVQNEVG